MLQRHYESSQMITGAHIKKGMEKIIIVTIIVIIDSHLIYTEQFHFSNIITAHSTQSVNDNIFAQFSCLLYFLCLCVDGNIVDVGCKRGEKVRYNNGDKRFFHKVYDCCVQKSSHVSLHISFVLRLMKFHPFLLLCNDRRR